MAACDGFQKGWPIGHVIVIRFIRQKYKDTKIDI
jgi:hypothetical protein